MLEPFPSPLCVCVCFLKKKKKKTMGKEVFANFDSYLIGIALQSLLKLFKVFLEVVLNL